MTCHHSDNDWRVLRHVPLVLLLFDVAVGLWAAVYVCWFLQACHLGMMIVLGNRPLVLVIAFRCIETASF